MEVSMAVSRSRKWQITINNPDEHEINSDVINKIMKEISWQYYCFAYEIGEQEHTPHIHLYFFCTNAVSFDRLKKLFPCAHLEACKGTSQDNRNYIRKEGKHSDKRITSLLDTFEEYGEMPLEVATKNETVSSDVLDMLENGCSNTEIIKAHPSYLSKISHLNACRTELLQERFKYCNRDNLTVHYIYGKTRTGKTTSVLNEYGNENVYRVNNYQHPFDNYNCEPILFLDEFHGNIPLTDILQILDKPPCRLAARYNDKYACYDKVFIASNIDLSKQYQNIQCTDVDSWNAFIARFTTVTEFVKDENIPFSDGQFNRIEHNPLDYML